MKTFFKKIPNEPEIIYPGMKMIKNNSSKNRSRNHFRSCNNNNSQKTKSLKINLFSKWSSRINNTLDFFYEKTYEIFSREEQTDVEFAKTFVRKSFCKPDSQFSAREMINSNDVLVNNGFTDIIQAGKQCLNRVINWLYIAFELDSEELNIPELRKRMKAYNHARSKAKTIIVNTKSVTTRSLLNYKEKIKKSAERSLNNTQKISVVYRKKMPELISYLLSLMHTIKTNIGRSDRYYRIE